MKKHIHIFGASGAGVTTLGKALSRELDYHFMDTDDFYWVDVLPKYSVTRPIDERIQLMTAEMDQHERRGWVNSGSLNGWGDRFIPRYDLAIYIYSAGGTASPPENKGI